MNKTQEFSKEVTEFLLRSGALKFGDFTLKSGRKAPYFMNAGTFSDGETLSRLGHYYAQFIIDSGLKDCEILFGPAYKGIPLTVATSMALYKDFGVKTGCAYDRKEAKEHGEGGVLWGASIKEGAKVVIVEDVVTAGTTLSKVIPLLKNETKANILGIVILVDRCEKGKTDLSAVKEAEQEHGVKIYPILTIHSIIEALSSTSTVLTPEVKDRVTHYLGQYGA